MQKLKTALVTAAAAALLTAGVAMAEMPKLGGAPAAPTGDISVSVLANTAKGYALGYPAGWQVVSSADVDYLFIKPDATALCAAFSGDIPDIAGIPEADLRAMLSVPLGEEFWDNVLFSSLPNKKYEHVGADPNHPGGWPIQTAIAAGDFAFEAGPVPSKVAAIMTFKAGKGYQVFCAGKSQAYEALKPELAAIFNSFKILK